MSMTFSHILWMLMTCDVQPTWVNLVDFQSAPPIAVSTTQLPAFGSQYYARTLARPHHYPSRLRPTRAHTPTYVSPPLHNCTTAHRTRTHDRRPVCPYLRLTLPTYTQRRTLSPEHPLSRSPTRLHTRTLTHTLAHSPEHSSARTNNCKDAH